MLANGVLPVDKPIGITSRRAVASVSSVLGASKAGHCGTLDQLATGVLVVCLGRATLLAGYLAAEHKTYEVEILFGLETDTYDILGEIVDARPIGGISERRVLRVLPEFVGELQQAPPAYSAVKRHGRPLYWYAREGRPVEAEPRKVSIDFIELVSFDIVSGVASAGLRIGCGPGTYVRSIVHDIGKLVGCGACVTGLRRTRSGEFDERDCVSLVDIIASGGTSGLDAIRTLEQATERMPTLVLDEEGAVSVGYGKPLESRWVAGEGRDGELTGPTRLLDADGKLMAIYGSPRPDDDVGVIGRARRVIRPAGGVEA